MKLIYALLAILAATSLPAQAEDDTIALYGLRHSHTWGHVTRILKSPHVRLVAIAETEPDLIAEARRLGAGDVPVYADPIKMLSEVKPAMVWGFMENNRHHEVVEACAPRGIHVIFEKPLAATHQQALRIRHTAARYGIQVLTNFSSAWDPALNAVKARMDAGEMGRPWRLHAAYGHTGLFNKVGRNHYFFGWLLDPEGNGGGALMDFGCYAVLDALHHLGRPQTVFAREFRLRPAEFPKVDDGATLLLTYPNAMAILEPSWNMPPGTERLEILTHAGYVRMADGKVEVRKGRDPATPLATPSLPPERSDPIGYLVHCIKSGKAVEGVVSLDFNVDVLEILDAAKKSIRSGKAVVLPRQPAPQGK